jgi:hypothetical protein
LLACGLIFAVFLSSLKFKQQETIMKSKFILILALTLGMLLGPMSVQALPIIFKASLEGLSEVPPNASPGTGEVTVTVDDVAKTMRVEAVFSDLIGTTLAAHIHCCVPPGTNAGVATTTPTFPGFPLGVTSGSYDALFDMTLASSFNAAFVTANGGTPNAAFNALLDGLNAGNAYFNLHTPVFPGGEVRGNLQVEIPEPATLLLLSLGIAGVTVHCLRRRRRVFLAR